MSNRSLFSMGEVVVTTNALSHTKQYKIDLMTLLGRHSSGDWGDLEEDDKYANEDALREWTRIFSSYNFAPIKIWIITEANRSLTTILLPEDY